MGWAAVAALLTSCGGDERQAPASPSLEAPVCVADGDSCDGQTPVRCVAGRPIAPLAPCGGARPFCVVGVCVACPPRAERCSPADPDRPERCADDGAGWTPLATCDAGAGQRCVAGRCGDPCAAAEGDRGSLGCSYWATQTPNTALNRAFPFAVAIANPQAAEVRVRVTGAALSEPIDATLAPGEARAITLPWVNALAQNADAPLCTGGDCEGGRTRLPRGALVANGAFHVTATAPVAAYQFNPLTYATPAGASSYTNDASLLLDERALSARYTVLSYAAGGAPGSFVAVTVTRADTTVTVRPPPGAGVPGDPTSVRREHLAPGDVLLVVSEGGGELSGAVVEASAPVAVFAGHNCTFVPSTRIACDHLEEQVPPVETLGRDFVLGPLVDRPGRPSLVRVISPADTVVRFDPPGVHRAVALRAGTVLELETAQAFRLTSTRPALVARFMEGQGEQRDAEGDPAMVYAVPAQQFRRRHDILVPDTYSHNFLGVVLPRGAVALLDDAVLDATRSTVGPWDVLSTPVSPGAHRLRTRETVPLGVEVYGTAPYTSYLYPGGLDLRVLPPD